LPSSAPQLVAQSGVEHHLTSQARERRGGNLDAEKVLLGGEEDKKGEVKNRMSRSRKKREKSDSGGPRLTERGNCVAIRTKRKEGRWGNEGYKANAASGTVKQGKRKSRLVV